MNTHAGCVLNLPSFPYQLSGECIGDQEKINSWGSFPTTLCCRDALTELSKALAQQSRFGINHTLFINQDQWVNCSSSFLDHQPSVSADSCHFNRLFNGSSKCSSISLPSMQQEPSYQHALNECADQFKTSSSFDDKCRNCTIAIVQARDSLLAQFKANRDNIEKAICTVAVVTSVAAGKLDDPLSVDAFYRCLHSLDVFGT